MVSPRRKPVIHLLFFGRYTSESSASFTRSPGRPSSFRSDEELIHTLDRLPLTVEDGY